MEEGVMVLEGGAMGCITTIIIMALAVITISEGVMASE